MGASRMDIFRKVRLPGALPAIFTGIKVGITYSVVGAIMGEWVGASRGIGVFMLRATNSFRTDWVFVSIAVTAALSLLLFGLVTLVEHAMLKWYYTSRRTEEWEEIH
jgi:ABC-type nitrate/sulfonate/bicarbonate transport system permease component